MGKWNEINDDVVLCRTKVGKGDIAGALEVAQRMETTAAKYCRNTRNFRSMGGLLSGAVHKRLVSALNADPAKVNVQYVFGILDMMTPITKREELNADLHKLYRQLLTKQTGKRAYRQALEDLQAEWDRTRWAR